MLSSCGILKKKIYDYSYFPKGAILTGEMKSGETVYLIREDSTKMAGIWFNDNNQAVTEIITFLADSTGSTNFTHGINSYSGKMTLKKSMEIKLILPEIPTLQIVPQTVRLKYLGMIPEKVDCVERYKQSVFKNIEVKKDIQYGTALGYYTSKPSDYISNSDYKHYFSEMLKLSLLHRGFIFDRRMEQLPLMLDFYQPLNDDIKNRPLLLFVHGGAFFFGDKENRIQKNITDDAVKKGFTVASINYRLGTSVTPGAIERTIYRNVQDTRAALRYLVHNKEKYGIDEKQIYLVGSSAGGIISLTTTFMDSNDEYFKNDKGLLRQKEELGDLDDSGNNLKNKFKVSGVISMWGGVTHLEMINKRIPTLLFHGTDDRIVPAVEGLPFREQMGEFLHRFLSSFGKIYGSESIYNHLKSNNVPVRYVPFHGAGHDLCINPDESLNENMDIIRRELSNFLYDNVSNHYFKYRLLGKTIVSKNDLTPVYYLENIENDIVQWHVEGGFITNQTNETIQVVWFSSHNLGIVTACITNETGVSHKKEVKVKIN